MENLGRTVGQVSLADASTFDYEEALFEKKSASCFPLSCLEATVLSTLQAWKVSVLFFFFLVFLVSLLLYMDLTSPCKEEDKRSLLKEKRKRKKEKAFLAYATFGESFFKLV